jgi:hypothetical protein
MMYVCMCIYIYILACTYIYIHIYIYICIYIYINIYIIYIFIYLSCTLYIRHCMQYVYSTHCREDNVKCATVNQCYRFAREPRVFTHSHTSARSHAHTHTHTPHTHTHTYIYISIYSYIYIHICMRWSKLDDTTGGTVSSVSAIGTHAVRDSRSARFT